MDRVAKGDFLERHGLRLTERGEFLLGVIVGSLILLAGFLLVCLLASYAGQWGGTTR